MYYEHIKGLNSELKVIECLTKDGWRLLHHRYKTKLAEIDLIFRKKQNIRMIEVKSIANWDFVSYRVSQRQRERLLRVYGYFQSQFDGEMVLELALVPTNGEILFIEIENFC